MVRIGDRSLIGVGPFDDPPEGTISAFLQWWRSDGGPGQRRSESQQRFKQKLDEKVNRLHRGITTDIATIKRRQKQRGAVDRAIKKYEDRIDRIEWLRNREGGHGHMYDLGDYQRSMAREEEHLREWQTEYAKLKQTRDRETRRMKFLTARMPLVTERIEKWRKRIDAVNRKLEQLAAEERDILDVRLPTARYIKERQHFEQRIDAQVARLQARIERQRRALARLLDIRRRWWRER